MGSPLLLLSGFCNTGYITATYWTGGMDVIGFVEAGQHLAQLSMISFSLHKYWDEDNIKMLQIVFSFIFKTFCLVCSMQLC